MYKKIKIRILVDSGIGYSIIEAKLKNINIIPLHIIINKRKSILDTYRNYSKYNFDTEITRKTVISSSQSNTNEIKTKFDKMLEKFDQIIVFFVPSSISGQYFNAKNILKDEKYNNKIFLFNNNTILDGTKYLIDLTLKYLKNTTEITKIFEKLNNIQKNLSTYIISNDPIRAAKSGRMEDKLVNQINPNLKALIILKEKFKFSEYKFTYSEIIAVVKTNLQKYKQKYNLFIISSFIEKHKKMIKKILCEKEFKLHFIKLVPSILKIYGGIEVIAITALPIIK